MIEARTFRPIRAALSAWLLACAALLLAGGFSGGASAQEVLFGDDNISARLVADGVPEPGETWHLAFQFTPKAKEWHGYWSNPGDAGLGMVLEWNLPEGWEVGEAQYPIPQRLIIAGLMNHVYEGNYAVIVPVTVPVGADPADARNISVFANYLACTDEICVPQDALLKVDPPRKSLSPFPRWRAQIAPLLGSEGAFETTNGTLRLAIPLPEAAALSDPHVFVETIDLVSYAAEQRFARYGDTVVAEIPLGAGIVPESVSGIVSFGGEEEGVRFIAKPGAVPSSGGTPIAGSMRELPSAWLALLGALLGGLLLNIMPCVFPILSLKALSLAKAGGEESAARRDAMAYTLGVVLSCAALGGLLLALRAAGEQVGWAFQLQSPGVVVALLVLAAAITANFAGVYEIPSFSIASSGGGDSKARGGWLGSFGTGVLAAIAATPCTGPFMAAAMGAALLLPVPVALGLFAALGLGLALPFLALGFVPALRSRLPKPGAWMEKFRRIMAIPMGLTALALIWLTTRLGGKPFAMIALLMVAGIMLALIVMGRLQKQGKLAWPVLGLISAPFLVFAAFALPASYSSERAQSAASIHAPRDFDQEALVQLRSGDAPVFIWFTADWCVTCKVNESVAIGRSRDKLRSMQIFAKHGLGLPVTAFAHDPKQTEEVMKIVGGAPVVIKLTEGTQGIGVVLGETDKSAKSVIEAFRGANVNRGGSAKSIKITPEERSTAVRAAKVMGLNVAGVDLLRANHGPVIMEVNSSPGLEGIENSTGINVADRIIEFIENNYQPGKTKTRGKG